MPNIMTILFFQSYLFFIVVLKSSSASVPSSSASCVLDGARCRYRHNHHHHHHHYDRPKIVQGFGIRLFTSVFTLKSASASSTILKHVASLPRGGGDNDNDGDGNGNRGGRGPTTAQKTYNAKKTTPKSKSKSKSRGPKASVKTRTRTTKTKEMNDYSNDDENKNTNKGSSSSSTNNNNSNNNNNTNRRIPHPIQSRIQQNSQEQQQQTTQTQTQPTIQAILIPRTLSIPRVIRLFSVFLFTASLSESFRTAGLPHAHAVIDILTQNGMMLHHTTTSSSSSTRVSVSPIDVYLAKKMCQSSSGMLLPPKYLPSPLPFAGLWIALSLQVGVTMLFPRWFIDFNVWLKYHRVDINVQQQRRQPGNSRGGEDILDGEHLRMISSRLCDTNINDEEKQENLSSSVDDDDDDYYYSSSQLMNNHDSQNQLGHDGNVGLAVLVRLSKRDREMSQSSSNDDDNDGDGKGSDVIRWIYPSEDKYQPYRYYIEQNQRRVYINASMGIMDDGEQQPRLTVQCHSGEPTFYKTQTLKTLLASTIPHGLCPTTTTNSTFTTKTPLQTAQNRYSRYSNITLPHPSLTTTFFNRISSPLAITQILGRLLMALEEDAKSSFWGLTMMIGRHWMDARKSVVVGRELAGEVGREVGGVGEMMVWALRPVGINGGGDGTKTKSKRKRKTKYRSITDDTRTWVKIPSIELLPGDIFCLPPTSTTSNNRKGGTGGITVTMPVDALLIEGSCVAQEAVITGESVPQAKVAIEYDLETMMDGIDSDGNDSDGNVLSMEGEHRNSVLFAGTSIVHSTNDGDDGTTTATTTTDNGHYYPKLPKELLRLSSSPPVKCLALRTGSYSTKGEIIRALSRNRDRTGSISTIQSEKDSLRLITALSTFAIAACVSLFLPTKNPTNTVITNTNKKVSSFRRLVQCTRIAIASIPSDLPMAISYLTSECSSILRREADVVCSEPGSLLTASTIDMVVFDKTGTLTSDTQSMTMVVSYDGGVNDGKRSNGGTRQQKHGGDKMLYNRQHPMANVVLAGCHSLVSIGSSSTSKIIGDPLDTASLEYSNWIFDPIQKAASAPTTTTPKGTAVTEEEGSGRNLVAKKLWQIKSFPFDPNLRQSSALVLVLHGDDKYRLWKVVKGSPDTMFPFLTTTTTPILGTDDDENDGSTTSTETTATKFKRWYDDTIQSLESQGIRVISMGVEEVVVLPLDDHQQQKHHSIGNKIFPDGLPQYDNDIDDDNGTDANLNRLIINARKIAAGKLHRNDIIQSSINTNGGTGTGHLANDAAADGATTLDFCGFSCLHAPMRPSSRRVVNEIRHSGTSVCMLTGDGIEAAFSIAERAAFFDYDNDGRANTRKKKSAILDIEEDGDHNSRLVWSILTRKKKKMTKKKKNMNRTSQYEVCNTRKTKFSFQSIRDIRQEQTEGKCTILATGRAVELALSKVQSTITESGDDDDEEQCHQQRMACEDLIQNLDHIAVIARASPQTKQKVISALKRYCGCNVMMCGDGVNDIAAMKTADISFALLNGFENEQNDQFQENDIENDRRTEKFYASALGKKMKRNDHNFVVGDGNNDVVCDDPTTDRRKRKIDEAMRQMQVDSRKGWKSIVNILKEERQRGIMLKKGGAGAARILAVEDSYRKAKVLRRGSTSKNEGSSFIRENDNDDEDNDNLATIKPGEASLAAAFTCLRPCVDGVETVIRSGIATAAFSLSLHRTIALGSLMACYNLATLYRDGFRYGKYMWNVELTLLMLLDQARYDISCLPCPRISKIRPRQSIFHLSSVLSICLQAVIHLYTITSGTNYANLLETKCNGNVDLSAGLKIRWRGSSSPLSGTSSSMCSTSSSSDNGSKTLLGRTPFRPNHITNTVFLLSVFQNCVISVVNHVGFPFHRSILESRHLCVWIGACTFFCIAAVVELFPALNQLLELAPMPIIPPTSSNKLSSSSSSAKIFMILLFSMDFVGSMAVDRLCLYLFDRELWDEKKKFKQQQSQSGSSKRNKNNDGQAAAAVEEDALYKERLENQTLLVGFGLLSLITILYAL